MQWNAERWLLRVALTALLGACAGNATRENPAGGRFLSDYRKLQPVKGDENEKMWLVADVETRAAMYRAVMIDQPEMFLSPGSPYKGAKPDDLKIIADELRNAFRKGFEMSRKYAVVDQPDSDVLYVRVAISDLMMERKPRPAVGYVPVDASRNTRVGITEKIDLKHARIEVEMLDAVTNEPLGAYVLTPPSDSDVSWDELSVAFSGAGKRVNCRLENATRPEQQREDCHAIPLTATR